MIGLYVLVSFKSETILLSLSVVSMTTSELLLSALVIIIDGVLRRLDNILMSCKFFHVKVVGDLASFWLL